MKSKSFNDVFSKNLRYYFDLSGMTQADVDDTFKKKIISILARLDEKEWDLLEKIAEDIVNAKEEKE